jgi:hypothetical protein
VRRWSPYRPLFFPIGWTNDAAATPLWCAAHLPISLALVRSISALLIALSASAAGARGTVVFAGGAWAAIDRGTSCEALTRSQRIAPRDKVQAVAGVTFTVDRRHWGEFHARLSRMPRADASAMLQIGNQPFLLVSRGGWAWSRGPLQAQAIIGALRYSGSMRLESRDTSGERFSDPYLLDGAPTAIDAAAARCALRGAGKIK